MAFISLLAPSLHFLIFRKLRSSAWVLPAIPWLKWVVSIGVRRFQVGVLRSDQYFGKLNLVIFIEK